MSMCVFSIKCMYVVRVYVYTLLCFMVFISCCFISTGIYAYTM